MENLQQSRNQILRGGGKQPPSIIESRVKRFVKCHHGVPIERMPAPERYAVAYVVYYKEAQDVNMLISLFKRSKSTINSYLSSGRFYVEQKSKKPTKFQKYTAELEEYLRTGWYRDICI